MVDGDVANDFSGKKEMTKVTVFTVLSSNINTDKDPIDKIK